jgi:hypothetical protein
MINDFLDHPEDLNVIKYLPIITNFFMKAQTEIIDFYSEEEIYQTKLIDYIKKSKCITMEEYEVFKEACNKNRLLSNDKSIGLRCRTDETQYKLIEEITDDLLLVGILNIGINILLNI